MCIRDSPQGSQHDHRNRAEQRGRDCERSADDRPDHPERPLAHRVGGDGDEGRYAGTAVLADGDAGSV